MINRLTIEKKLKEKNKLFFIHRDFRIAKLY